LCTKSVKISPRANELKAAVVRASLPTKRRNAIHSVNTPNKPPTKKAMANAPATDMCGSAIKPT